MTGYEYEEGDEEDEEDVGEEEEDDARQANYVPPPPPTPATEPPTQAPAHTEDFEELSNEIDPLEEQKRDQDKALPGTTNPQTDAGVENVDQESTQDPYAPRVLDDNCGSDNGGCDQKCERVLYPGENQPRLQCSCGEGFSLDPNDYSTCHGE